MRIGDFFAALLGLPKTIYYNFKSLPFSKAIHLPILVSASTSLKGVRKNSVFLSDPKCKLGMVRIGFFSGIGGTNSRKTIIRFEGGKIYFGKDVSIGRGSTFAVSGRLHILEGFHGGANLIIVCRDEISIGKNALVAWNCTIMDSDGHDIFYDNNVINNPRPISIGDNCWIGSGVLILKGSRIQNNTIIASNTTIHGELNESNRIVCEEKCVVLKKEFNYWKR